MMLEMAVKLTVEVKETIGTCLDEGKRTYYYNQ